ncbi:uncharacterized protein LOC136073934 [Hydra vulgaris]|uniref:uncharacterized protein LOC136073934 n=1 Tax=Hydra vulgaris TaxID=6087 RepID=UPI0032EA5A37
MVQILNLIMMLLCKFCNFSTSSLKNYVQHNTLHSCAFDIPCGFVGCKRNFRTLGGFATHMYRFHDHTNNGKLYSKFASIEKKGVCSVLSCKIELPFHKLLVHLKSHAKNGVSVTCPYDECEQQYKVKSSFTAHLSRYHIMDKQLASCNQVNTLLEITSTTNNHPFINENTDRVEFHTNDVVYNIALFLLKLQCQYHIPSTTVQYIAEQIFNLNTINQNQTEFILSNNLSSSIPQNELNYVIQQVRNKDAIVISLSKEKGLLRSAYIRKEYFKKKLDFVGATEVFLGRNEHGLECYSYYVPIKETLQRLCMNSDFILLISKQIHTRAHIYTDYFNGEAFCNNPFFLKYPNSLHLFLYQDTFELVNPLGSARNKHQISATYMVVGNLPPELRTSLNNIFLVQLCRDKDLKSFSQATIFSELLRDLKNLEVDGVQIGINHWRAGVVAILGDNLGSHFLGGYSLGFSSKKGHICRFCLLKGNDLQVLPYKAEIHSVEHYNNCILTLNANPQDRFCFGITKDSIFNQLESYSTCAPGLPACLAHDLFEGVVQYDLAMAIKKLVKDGCFTYQHINGAIRSFSFKGDDKGDRPALLTAKGDKLKGHAVQNWVFLRFLPLLLIGRIFNYDHNVWQLILLLREVTELICGGNISLSQVSLLQHLINEYLEQRKEIFPDVPLRPKHH